MNAINPQKIKQEKEINVKELTWPMTKKEFAAFCKQEVVTISRWMEAGYITYSKIGTSNQATVLFRESDYNAMMDFFNTGGEYIAPKNNEPEEE